MYIFSSLDVHLFLNFKKLVGNTQMTDSKERFHRFYIVDGPPTSYAAEGKWHWNYDLNVPYKLLNYYSHIFVHIPKTGGTSIRYFPLKENNKPFSLGHIYAHHYPLWCHSKMFTIVRNPYSRLVSAYMFMKRGGFNNNAAYSRLVENYPTFESWVFYGLNEHDLTFDPQNIVSELTVSQHEFICDEERTFLIPKHRILHFENYASELERYLEVPKEKQSHHNTSFEKGKEETWKNYYQNKAVQDKVYRLYQMDFFFFDYNYQIE